MGKSSGSIWVSLGLKTSEFTKGIKRSRKELTGFQKFGQGLKGMFNPLTIGIGVVAGLGAAFNDAARRVSGFDSSIKNLSSITGAVGEDLEFLKEQAIKLGSSSTLSASQVADGFKLIASAKPELLESGVALSLVTEQAILLAEAAKIDMVQASNALTLSLNQFGGSAKDSAKFVDILAAGSKMGAGDIEFLNGSLQKVGGIAAKAGLSFLDTTAAIETLAPVMATGEEAGTAFRNILVNLQKEGIGFASGQFNINDALEEAKTMFDNMEDPIEKAAKQTKLFGKQNLAAGQQLINNIPIFEEFQTSLDKNGVAAKQAATNYDTFEGSTKRLDSAYEGLILSIEDGEGVIADASRWFVDLFTGAITGLTNLDLMWKSTFKGMGKFTQRELERSLDGGFIVEETGVVVSEIAKMFDKIPLDKIKGNAKQVQDAWIKAMPGEELEDALALFKGYVKRRVDQEKELIESSKKVSETKINNDKLAAEKVKELTKEQIEFNKEIKKTEESVNAFAASLLATDYEEMNYGGELEGITEGNKVLDKILADAEKNGAKLEIPMTVIPLTEDEQKELDAKMQKLKEQADAVGGAVAGAFANMSNNMIDSLGLASTGLEGFVGGMLKTVTSLISMMLAASISQAVMGAEASGVATGPAAVFTTPAFIATAVGGVLSAFAAIPAFADGGIVSGPTMGLMGEYAGAKSNPEVIAPLDKLKSLIPQNEGMGGNVTFEIKGNTLVGVLNRQGKSSKYSN